MSNSIEILKRYESLQIGFKYITENSTSVNLPYHNLNHCLTVMKNSYEGFIYHGFSNDYIEAGLFAALFHDANHSGGKLTDDINVANAKKIMVDCIETSPSLHHLLKYIPFMYDMLDATQYPYIIKSEDLFLHQAIIRDADLMQIYEPDFISQLLFGLSQEMKFPFKDMVNGNRAFLESMPPITDWAKEVKEDKWPLALRNLDFLSKILG